MGLTLEFVEGEDGFFDGHMLELDFLCEADFLEGLATHEQAGVLGHRMPNGLGHKWHCPRCPWISLNDVHLKGFVCWAVPKQWLDLWAYGCNANEAEELENY